MNKKFFAGLVPLLAIVAFAVVPVTAQAAPTTQTLVSNETNSFCINPTEKGFEPVIGGNNNYLPLETSHEGPFPDTGAACGSEAVTHPTTVSPAFPGWGTIAGTGWVGLNSSGTDSSNPPPKYYIYDATFTLCESQVAGTTITGEMYADNEAGAFLNGKSIGFQPLHGSNKNFGANGAPATTFTSSASFKAGVNTVQFVVFDETGGATGLDFSATVTSPACVTQTVVSDATNSLCVNPTATPFAPVINSKINYKPITKANKKGGPFPETGTACAPETATHPTAMGGPGEKAGPYLGAIPGASWVSINNTGEDASNPPPKYYIYNATFTLCHNQVPETTVSGTMFADNVAGAFLNGKPIGNQPFPGTGANFNGPPAGGWPFGPASSPLKAGPNTLQFVVLDETAPFTGLDFSATVTSSSECKAEAVPGLGRCIKVAAGTGNYKTATCEAGDVPAGNYEWWPEAIKNKFTSALKPATIVTFETKNGTKVTCTGETDVGEYIGETEDRETITYTGCETSKIKCNSVGHGAGEITTTLLRSTIGWLNKAKKQVGVDLAPLSGATFAEFDCGALHVEIKGSVVAPIPGGKMLLTYAVTFSALKGKQKYEKLEGAPKDTLEMKFGAGPVEQSGLSATEIISNEEKLEIKRVS